MADKPVTREEKYLAYLTGDYKGELPKPITRKEKYLYELCLKGIGGEISPEEIKNAVNEYLEKNPVKPGATTEQAQQIEQNKTDVASLKEETGSLKEDLADRSEREYFTVNDINVAGGIDKNTGENIALSWHYRSDFIPVCKGDIIQYTLSSFATTNIISFYDINKKYIIDDSIQGNGNISSDTIIVSKTGYAKFVCNGDYLPSGNNKAYFRIVEKLDSREELKEFKKFVYDSINDSYPVISALSGEQKYSNKIIDATSVVGESIVLSNNSYRNTFEFSIPDGAIGAFVYGCGNDDGSPIFAVTDHDGNVLCIDSSATTNVERVGIYANFNGLDADKLYVTCSTSDNQTVFFDYGYDSNIISHGKPIPYNCDNKQYSPFLIKGHGTNIVTVDSNGISITFDTVNARNVGFYIKTTDVNYKTNFSKLTISLMNGGTTISNDEILNTAFMYGEWLFIKVCTQNKLANTIKISSDGIAKIVISDKVIINRFDKPYLMVNFDQAWKSSLDCGAYDYLIENKIPFTITGRVFSTNDSGSPVISSDIENKVSEMYSNGWCSVGIYGNEFLENPFVETINDMETLDKNLKKLISRKEENGFNVRMFGGVDHKVSRLMRRVCKENGIYIMRNCIATNSANIGIVSTEKIVYATSLNLFMANGNPVLFFTHGVSSNPSSEEQGWVGHSLTDFKNTIDTYIKYGAIGISIDEYCDRINRNL